MTKTLTPDICVIGGGAGGLSLALGAAAAGASVVMVEKERPGIRLDRGELPLRALAAAARHAHALRHGSGFGIADAEPDIDFRSVRRHIRETVEATAPNRAAERLGAMGILVLKAEALFKDRRTVTAGEHEVRARHFVVATGSTPRIPPIAGLDAVDWLDCETVFDLVRRPGRLVVVGGEPAGLELAQAFARLGAQATVVAAGAVLPGEDPELAAILVERLRAEGVAIREHAAIERVERRGKTGIRLHVANGNGGEEAIDGTHLLVAAGRRSAVDGLDLGNAGIAFSEAGIKITDRLRTTNRRVHAVGDVTGRSVSAHAASHQAELVLRQILSGEAVREDRLAVPRAVFADPELAHVGLSEAEARQGHARIGVLRWPYAENESAQAERRSTGFVKLIADRGGRILGVSIVGANAGELIGVWALAMAKGLSVRDMAGHVPVHPTMGEIGKRAAIAYFSGATRKGGARRILRLLRISG